MSELSDNFYIRAAQIIEEANAMDIAGHLEEDDLQAVATAVKYKLLGAELLITASRDLLAHERVLKVAEQDNLRFRLT